MGRLTALQVKRAGPGRHGDGDGLYLVVSNTGARKWVLRVVQKGGKRRDAGLGSARDVTLAEARELSADMRRAFRRGEDPIAQRKKDRETIPTFKEAALAVHQERQGGWKNPKHARQWLSTLETYAFPKLGELPVNEVDGPLVRDVLAEIWLTIPETARRVRQRIGIILDYAHSKGWRPSEMPVRAITRGLPQQPKNRGHIAAMPWQEVPAFIRDMESIISAGEPVRLALEFLILTAARSGEVRGMLLPEIDFEAKCWSIPAERMKADRPHRIPLSDQAIAILERALELRTSADPKGLVFEGSKPGAQLSDMTLSMPMKRAGLEAKPHGFRSSFRDWCNEATNTPRAVAEACLAHAVKDATEAAYSRTDHYERRKSVMNSWSRVCSEGESIVLLQSAAG